MNHRTIKRHAFMMRPTQIIAFLLIAILPSGFAPAVTAADRPNIVVLLADDMHWHHPGFNGGPVSTPNLDRLAQEGTHLTAVLCPLSLLSDASGIPHWPLPVPHRNGRAFSRQRCGRDADRRANHGRRAPRRRLLHGHHRQVASWKLVQASLAHATRV